MALSNCSQCMKLFKNAMSRSLCPACFGQQIFGKKEPPYERPAPEPVSAHRIIGPEHALRCEVRAQEGRAHGGSVRWGLVKFW